MSSSFAKFSNICVVLRFQGCEIWNIQFHWNCACADLNQYHN